MGLGIEARAEKYQRWWSKHLALSREFQQRSFELLSQHQLSLAVLGAGRLLDLNREVLPQHFQRVVLYDADRGCLARWRELENGYRGALKLDFVISDLSASLDLWTAQLRGFLETHCAEDAHALCGFLDQLEPRPALDVRDFAAVLSTNLLSQIPLYWRDRATKIIARKWGERAAQSETWEAALERSMAKLQEQHMQQLRDSQARLVVLITDGEFMYYRPDLPNWQCEAALLRKDLLELPGYRLALQNSWFWHILPYAAEHSEFGEIHRVEARAWLRS